MTHSSSQEAQRQAREGQGRGWSITEGGLSPLRNQALVLFVKICCAPPFLPSETFVMVKLKRQTRWLQPHGHCPGYQLKWPLSRTNGAVQLYLPPILLLITPRVSFLVIQILSPNLNPPSLPIAFGFNCLSQFPAWAGLVPMMLQGCPLCHHPESPVVPTETQAHILLSLPGKPCPRPSACKVINYLSFKPSSASCLSPPPGTFPASTEQVFLFAPAGPCLKEVFGK